MQFENFNVKIEKKRNINDPDLAFETIMDAIVTQELAPNQKVSENVFNEQFDISRSISRNLMERLISRHILIDVSPRVTRVSPLALIDVKQNFLLRKMLLPKTFAIAAANINSEAYTAIDTKLGEMDTFESRNSLLNNLKLNKELNLIVCEYSRFPLMSDFVLQLEYIAMRVYWVYTKMTGTFPFSKEQHQRVFDAIRSKDTDVIEKVVFSMLNQTEERIINAILSSDHIMKQSLLVPST